MTNSPVNASSLENSQPKDVQTKTAGAAHGRTSRRSCKKNPAWGDALRMAETKKQWTELIEHLPENAQQLWRTLGDLQQFWLVLSAFGGQSIRVPRNVPKNRAHVLRRVLGVTCLRKLMATFGGTSLYVPRCTALITRLRQHEIINAFSRCTGQGSSSTAAVASLARRHGISDRRVWQILKKEASVPPQARLLRKLGDSAQSTEAKHDNAW